MVVIWLAGTFLAVIDYKHRYVYITGAGGGLQYVASTVRSLEVSGNMKTLASGIASAGTAIGVILIGQVRGVTMTQLGWRKGLLVEIAFLGISLPCGLLLKIRTTENSTTDKKSEYILPPSPDVKYLVDHSATDEECASYKLDTRSDASLNSLGIDGQAMVRETENYLSLGEQIKYLLTDVVFYLTLLCAFLIIHPMYGSIHYLPGLVETCLELTPQQVSSITTVVGSVSLVTRIILGVISNHDVEVRYVLYVGINVISAASSCFIGVWSTFHLMIACAALSGVMIGETHYVCIQVCKKEISHGIFWESGAGVSNKIFDS